MAMLDYALQYVSQGFRVFPVNPDKTPLTKHGMKDATETQLGVREYWTKWPNAGIAISTEGLIVLDFDANKGGLENMDKLSLKYNPLPPTRVHRTGGGGLHFIYYNNNGSDIRNAVNLDGFSGVDIRANGGYIVVPPSRHSSGGSYLLENENEIADAPGWLIELCSAWKPQADNSLNPTDHIPEGQRNDTLTRHAGSMRRRGFSERAILAALKVTNQEQCNPPLPEDDLLKIAVSVARYAPDKTDQTDETVANCSKLTKTDMSVGTLDSKKVWQFIDEWLVLHQGERFDLDTICRHLSITDREGKHQVAKKLWYEVDRGNLEKSDRLYSYIDNTYSLVDWVNANGSNTLNFKWPYGVEDESRFGFDGHVLISPGDIIVVAGMSNMGKTCFCLNLLWANMDTHQCTLMGNEYTPIKFKRRASNMTWANPIDDNGKPKFELIERRERWKDIIRPNNINIIDWINLADNFYQIGAIIEGIQSKLKKGIAVITLQKSEDKKHGLGGGFSEHLASFYISIDYERLTVVKAKEWETVNPNGKTYGFQIVDRGSKFNYIREIKPCPVCRGKRGNKGCQQCIGTGFVNEKEA